jgi:polar amino acid transport system substrate-binding protein
MKIRTVFAVLVAGAALAACSGANDNTEKADGSLARVQKAGKLVVCSSNDVPYFYRDPKNTKLTGTDYDMVREIAAKLNISKIEMFEVPISGIIPALKAKRCDLISDNIAITAKRSEEIAFSGPMYKAGQALVVPKGNPGKVNTQADFAGNSVGSYLGTIQLDYLLALQKKDSSIDVKQYKAIPEILADLKAGRLDAGVFDDMVASYTLKTNASLPIEIINYKLPVGDYAVGAGFRKEDQSLRNAFSDANRDLMFDGSVAKIFKKWGLEPIDRYAAFPNCCVAAEN